MKMFFQHRFKNIWQITSFLLVIYKNDLHMFSNQYHLIFLTSKNQKFFSDPLSYFIYIYIYHIFTLFFELQRRNSCITDIRTCRYELVLDTEARE